MNSKLAYCMLAVSPSLIPKLHRPFIWISYLTIAQLGYSKTRFLINFCTIHRWCSLVSRGQTAHARLGVAILRGISCTDLCIHHLNCMGLCWYVFTIRIHVSAIVKFSLAQFVLVYTLHVHGPSFYGELP